MEDPTRTGLHDLHLASRKAEEAAWRRFQAAAWLETLVGPLGTSKQPSERELLSCLRNGLILCNAINKIQPGAVTKVVENHFPSESLTWESQPLPAYQYFENVRNFLVAVAELKLPAFEASDLERDNMEAGSSAKVVDCILALKSYHEWKLMTRGNGIYKHVRSPMVSNSANRMNPRSSAAISSNSCRRLDLSDACEKKAHARAENMALEDLLVKALAEFMVDTKENIDDNLLACFRNGNKDPVRLLSKIMTSYFDEQHQNNYPELRSALKDYRSEETRSIAHSASMSLADISSLKTCDSCKACSRKSYCNHWRLLQTQEKDLLGLKALLSKTKTEFEDLQSQLRFDLKKLGSQVQELSTAANGYQRVLKENRSLYNMVQDLKGNIQVYCRIRPAFNAEVKSVIEFIGEDGSVVIFDPLKPQKDGRKVFQFNRVFGPTSTQDEVFEDTRPLIRSVMDGYNVCIFAYGQTGSGKTHTMCGPSGGSSKDVGINHLALNDLFDLSNRRKDIIKYDIYVQMVEIYNEQVHDLLEEDSSTSKLEIRSCISNGGLSLPNATMHSVKSTADVLNLMKIGDLNRAVGSTAINNRSSRSHSVLTVHVHGKDNNGSILRSNLHLVDLAGSERVDKSEVTGDRLKEAQYINRSLSCLGDVITALAQKSSHIPYRNSKLTHLLQDSLGGHAKTLMFAHVSPEGDSFGETVSTLKFAQRVSTVELGAARINKESSEVLELKQQIESLKKAVAKKEAQSSQIDKTNEPKLRMEQTPPGLRKLSIESSGSINTEKTRNLEDKKESKTPCVKSRPRTEQTPAPIRRLSLEGPKCSNNGSSASKTRAIRTESATKIPSVQVLPKTPEPLHNRNEVASGIQSELNINRNSHTPNLVTKSTNGRGSSQIRKSLRNFGKLISGSEKRSQQIPLEERTPINGRTPRSANNERTLRRQSLTGIQLPGSDRSRRSSLGGKSTDTTNTKETRNAKTPPPVHPSSKIAQRWQ